MSRALEKEFGVAPDLDVEAQRAILILEKPVPLNWKRAADLIGGASYTFAGAHFRARGRIRKGPDGRMEFELAGSAQVMAVTGSADPTEGEVEIAARLEEWDTEPKIVVLQLR